MRIPTLLLLVMAVACTIDSSAARSPDQLPAPSTADLACRAAGIQLTKSQLAQVMGYTVWQVDWWCDMTSCESVLAELNTQLHDAYMDCPLRLAAFLAVRGGRGAVIYRGRYADTLCCACPYRAVRQQVRHETAALTQLHQPADNGAGVIHMLPYNFRYACEGSPPLQDVFATQFSDRVCSGTTKCQCGSDYEAGTIIREPKWSVLTGVWWITHGAQALIGDECNSLRADMDVGVGACLCVCVCVAWWAFTCA